MLSVALIDRAGTPAAVAVPVHPDPSGPARPGAGAGTVPADLPAFLAEVRASGEAGRVDVLPLPGRRPHTVYLVGVGVGGPGDLRRAGAAMVRAAIGRPGGARRLVCWLGHGAGPEEVRALAESAMLASYAFSRAARTEPSTLREVALVSDGAGGHPDSLEWARAAAGATALARDLANTPSLDKSPAWLARQAERELRGPGLTVTIRDERQLAAEGFGGILAVGGGSARPPRLIEARYAPRGARSGHVVLVGKGITFDTGGLSLKPNDGMIAMKTDMAGGAVVLAAVAGAARLRLPVRVTALVPAAENHVSGGSYRPGDVIRHYGGRTTEVLNTDAEGRLVLADALAYAVARLRPDALVDVATLTGAVRMALGTRTAGLFSTDDALADRLRLAGEATGEQLWRMPLTEDYLPLLDSAVADAVNSAGNPGAITAALFLRPFTGTAAWAHLDVAGTGRAAADDGELTRGATGFGVRTLLRYLQWRAAQGHRDPDTPEGVGGSADGSPAGTRTGA
ncbi:MAG TPA: leucyl aminopeptidase [Mycobacteriales bacterium]|nr:leucyl aminopeptidase [Mycobacteriales bacterium]